MLAHPVLLQLTLNVRLVSSKNAYNTLSVFHEFEIYGLNERNWWSPRKKNYIRNSTQTEFQEPLIIENHGSKSEVNYYDHPAFTSVLDLT